MTNALNGLRTRFRFTLDFAFQLLRYTGAAAVAALHFPAPGRPFLIAAALIVANAVVEEALRAELFRIIGQYL